MTITASGCDGSTWKARLVDKSVLACSDPAQGLAKINFENLEACQAAISKTFIFDLKPPRMKSRSKVSINLDGCREGYCININCFFGLNFRKAPVGSN